jgi:hypothetical protein
MPLIRRPAPRGSAALLPLLAAAALAGCGDDGDPRPVRLQVTAPSDAAVVHEDSVEIRGRVRPAHARVLVLGRRADVDRGEFHARVPLRTGANVIDVSGTAHGAAPGFAAVRVEREVVVTVPDLAGAAPGGAESRLEGLGLRSEVEERGGLLDRLLGGDRVVCESDPPAGSELPRGATVRLTVSALC